MIVPASYENVSFKEKKYFFMTEAVLYSDFVQLIYLRSFLLYS